jgi:putative copper export protein
LAREPLARTGKIIAAILGATWISGLIALYLYTRHEKRGQKRKAKEILTWFFYGFGLRFVVLVAAACH